MIDFKQPQQMLRQQNSQQRITIFLTPYETGISSAKLNTISASSGLTTTSGLQVSPLDNQGFELTRKHSIEEAKKLAEQWSKLVLDRNAAVNANTLTYTVKPLFQALSKFGAGAIDLRGLPVDKVNGVHLAVVLRATLSIKTRTPGWEEALTIARDALRRDSIDETDALYGLI